MKLDCLQFPSAGKPLIVRTLGWLLIAISLGVSSRAVFLIGVGLIIASQGRDVLVNNGLVLRYALLKVRIGGIDEIANLSEMNRGTLIKWGTGLLLEPLFLLLSLLVLLGYGARLTFILPVLVYWGVLYAEIIFVPLRVLRERISLAVLLPLGGSLPFALLNERALTAMPFVWVVGTLSILNLLTREAVVIRTAGKSYLLLCENSERVMGVLQNGPQND